jgi:hypothetical protein
MIKSRRIKKWIDECESSSAVELHLAKVDVEGSIPFSRSLYTVILKERSIV